MYPNYGTGWDASNDFSNTELLTKTGETDEDGTVHGIVTPYVPVYVNGELYYGIEPDGTSADGNSAPQEDTKPTEPKTEPTTEPVTEPTPSETAPDTTAAGEDTTAAPGGSTGRCGDVNGDGTVDIMDVIALNKFLLGSSTLDTTAKTRADADRNGELDSTDSLNILKYVVEIISELPI